MIYLLDTDTIVFISRGYKLKSTAAHRTRARKILHRCRQERHLGNTIVISAITLSELEFGCHNSGDYAREWALLRRLIRPLPVLDYDAVRSPVHYGEVRHDLVRRGQIIGGEDMLIAAHALSLGATLITNNQAHFQRVPTLLTANWS